MRPGEQDYSEVRVAAAQIVLDAHVPMLTALRGAVKWCHHGHGSFPIERCGLCSKLLHAIAKGEGR